VTAELVDAPESALAATLSTAHDGRLAEMERAVSRIADDWSRRNGIEMVFHPEAARRLAQSALDADESLEAAFQRTFKNYEHGLNLIQKTRGVSRFEITEAVVEDPVGTLDRWIRDFYIVQPGATPEGGRQ
jgi:hypothetical protein